ncbi:hypothetical protein AC249_AIPGENE23390 [Exaiptasia diaphana]|nr:hypothetical protein AC249_AIPGENE23390 [Exaiptasia diaphana]
MTTATCELNKRTKNSQPLENYKSKNNSIYCPWTLSNRPVWEKVNANPVCFGARDNRFGSFLINVRRGLVSMVQLIHLSGGVTCKVGGQLSNWGCDDGWLATVFTDKSNNRLAPEDRWIVDWNKLVYKIGDIDPFLSKIRLRLIIPMNITAGQEYRLWYGEDLKDVSEVDNSGTVCVDVNMYGNY